MKDKNLDGAGGTRVYSVTPGHRGVPHSGQKKGKIKYRANQHVNYRPLSVLLCKQLPWHLKLTYFFRSPLLVATICPSVVVQGTKYQFRAKRTDTLNRCECP